MLQENAAPLTGNSISLNPLLGRDIRHAISLNEAAARVGALRKIAGLLDSPDRPAKARASATSLSNSLPPDEEVARLEVDRLVQIRPVHELDIMAYVDDGQPSCAIFALARLARLPIGTVKKLFASQHPDFLLVNCRAHGFAWSTTRRLLGLMHAARFDAARLAELSDEYHDMPIAMAQRFGRFLSVHFPADQALAA